MKRLIPLAAALLVMMAGCAEKPAMIITGEQNDSQITVAAGTVFQVKLEARLSTGYGWELVQGATIVSLTGKPSVLTAGRDVTGALDYQVFTFRADKKGETVLSFRYRRPWMENEPPEKVFQLKVMVN